MTEIWGIYQTLSKEQDYCQLVYRMQNNLKENTIYKNVMEYNSMAICWELWFFATVWFAMLSGNLPHYTPLKQNLVVAIFFYLAYMAAIEFKNDRYKTLILEVHVCHLILLIIRIPKCIICHMSDISLWGYAEVKRSKFTWKCELLTLNNLIIYGIIWVWSLFVQKVQRSTTFSHLGMLGLITKHRTNSIPKLIKTRTNQTVTKTSQSTWSHAFYNQIHSQWGCLARHFAI